MGKLRFRSVFISDVHLGTPDCKAEFLLDFLNHIDTRHLYLVGDIIDLEALGQRSYWPASHGAVVAELLDLAQRGGTQVVYIPGNHDAPLRGLCGRKIGEVEVRLNALHRTADGRLFRVSHGDEFDEEGYGKTWLTYLGDHGYRLLCRINRWFNGIRRGLRLPYFPLSILAKSRIGKAWAYIQNYERTAARSAAEQGLHGHICGHIHFGGIREIEGVLYLNDGDWVEHCTALVEHEDGLLELIHWSDRRGSLGHARRDQLQPSSVPALAFAGLAAIPVSGLTQPS